MGKKAKSIGMGLLLFLTVGIVVAQSHTPAGTVIRNQAVATYQVGGSSFTSTSNEVITEVLPIYGFDILLNGQDASTTGSPAAVQSAYPGNEVYFQYEVRNYANTGDTINLTELVKDGSSTMPDPSSIEVYEDENANGVVDPGEALLGTWDPSGNTWTSVSQDLDGDGKPDLYVPEEGSKYFVMAYTVPRNATAGQVYFLGVSGQSHGDNTKVDPEASESGNNYHELTVTNDASMSGYKTASPLSVASGDTINYTIQGSNVGGQPTYPDTFVYYNGSSLDTATGVILKDAIDTSKTYLLPNSITGSPAGVILYHYNGSQTVKWYNNIENGIDSTDIDSIAYVFPNIDPGQQYNLTFKVIVRSGLTSSDKIHNQALIFFRHQGGGHDEDTTSTNVTTVSVSPTNVYGAHLGYYEHPDSAVGGDTNKDTASVDTARAGLCIMDTLSVKNTGNTNDTYKIDYSVISGNANWISGVVFLNMDGLTPLSNNEIGPLAPNDTAHFIVRYCISDTVNTTGNDLVLAIRAVSESDTSALDTTRIVVDSIIGVGVDIGNRDGVSGSVNNTPADSATNPGRCVTFPLDILNTGGTADVYTLSALVPNNWTVKFYPDEDNDGVIDPGSNPITQIGPIDPGQEGHAVAVVCVPDGESPQTSPTKFIATSTRDTTVSDTIADSVTVNAVCAIDISPDRHGTGFPGGEVTYMHWVVNRGNQGTNVHLNVNSQRGWTYVILDSNMNIIDSLTNLGAGDSAIIYVRAFIPSDAPIGIPDNATVTASAVTGGCSDQVTDITDVVSAALALDKYIMDIDHDGSPSDSGMYSTGHPSGGYVTSGDTLIWYRVHYKNLSSDTVKAPIIYDKIPTWTTIIVETGGTPDGTVPAGQLLYSYSNDGGVTWSAWTTSHDLPAGWNATDVTNIRFGIDRNSDGTIDENDYILPGESGYVQIKVKIK